MTSDPRLDDGWERFWRRAYDTAVLVYGAACAVIVLSASDEGAGALLLAAMCLCPAALAPVLARACRRHPNAWFPWLARYFVPLLFLTFMFRLTGQLAPFFPLGHFDPLVMGWDGLVFGDPHVSLRFQRTAPFAHPAFGELMCAAYLSYYLLIPAFVAGLAFTRLRRRPGPDAACAWYTAVMLISYYLHYAVFFLFPVAGPAFHIEGGIALDPGYVVNHLHHFVVSRGDVPGGCFPSSHVSIALVHAFVAARLGWRRVRNASLAITAAICLSIVYTRAHYAVDAIAGLASGVLCWVLLDGIARARVRRAAPAKAPPPDGT